MKASLWTLALSLLLVFTAKAEQPSPPTSANAVATNNTAAGTELRAKAEKGDAVAQNKLGDVYSTGDGVTTNFVEAVKWYRRAAEQSEPHAQFNLGSCYYYGTGVPQDYAEAVHWFRKAVEQGESSAQFNLGMCYYEGQGILQDYAEAVKWFRKAAEQGDARAQYNLGFCYYHGQGIPQDYAEARKWFRKAAEQGDASSQYNVGVDFYRGLVAPKDYAEAVKWFRKAAEQGMADAQYWLGVTHELGRGVPQDYVEAYKWYNLAAAQNQANAIHNRDNISDSMTPSQIAEGQRLSREFVARKEDGVSNRGDVQDAVVIGNLPRFTGTGFFVTDDGCLLTSYHVVEDAARITVRTKAGTFAAMLVKADKANDVALLKVDGKFSALSVAPSRGIKLGESVFTIGFPNIELQGFAPKLTKGEISSMSGIQDDPREFQISVSVQPGNSGGALVDERGNVIGLVAAKLDAATALAASGALPENVNYAVKSSLILSFLEAVPEVRAKVKSPSVKEQRFEEAVKSAEEATVLVLVY